MLILIKKSVGETRGRARAMHSMGGAHSITVSLIQQRRELYHCDSHTETQRTYLPFSFYPGPG